MSGHAGQQMIPNWGGISLDGSDMAKVGSFGHISAADGSTVKIDLSNMKFVAAPGTTSVEL